jgi:transposase
MVTYPRPAVERAMRIQEVILRAMSGQINWIQAAQILGKSPRSLRRWRERYEVDGYDGLLDRRTGRPSPRRAPVDQVERVLRLYRETYDGYNVRHFHGIVKREHGVTLSYTYVRLALQGAGLVKKKRKRGRHRKRRERKECRGQMLHLDGSKHRWLSLRPEQWQTLILICDDATGEVLHGRFWEREGTFEVMTGLREVFMEHGLPESVYTDRAGWAFYTPRAGGKVDKSKLTQVGRALDRLGVEHIPAYSPQARGRSERLFRTFQGRLVNELRVAGIRTISEANQYLREVFIPRHNAEFARAPADSESAFVPVAQKDLDEILCIEQTRRVTKDNTVVMNKVRLQIDKQPGRATCAGLRVTVRRHLDGAFVVLWGKRVLGRYDAQGSPMEKAVEAATSLRATPCARWPLEETEATGQITC